MATRKRKLTDEDKRAAARVRALWADYKKKNPGISQDSAAARAGFGQSAFSQFLLGRVPIRLSPALKFAKLFGVPPAEIRGDLGEIAYATGPTKAAPVAKEPSANELSADTLDIARVYDGLQPQAKDTFRELLFMFSVIDRKFPWMRRGRPKGESYSKYEERIEQNMEAKITLVAQRLKG